MIRSIADKIFNSIIPNLFLPIFLFYQRVYNFSQDIVMPNIFKINYDKFYHNRHCFIIYKDNANYNALIICCNFNLCKLKTL